jgi:hypothetical protein
MFKRFMPAGALFVLAACGGGSSSPGTPTNPGPTQPQTRSISGRITDIVTGAGVAGASITVGGAQAVKTSGDGSWRVDVSPPSTDRLLATVNAGGFHQRETYVTWTSADRSDVGINIFPDRAPFVLGFYRELVRNALEGGSTLEPVRRWTTSPNFYIRTLNPKTNQPLAPSEVDTLVQNVRDAVSQVTGGLLSVGTIETGVADRPDRIGTITIKILHEPDADYCGTALVGANPGSVDYNYGRCQSACAGLPLGPELIAHEIGHALGFWHVSQGVMQPEDFVNCPIVNFTQPERLHGSIAYRRPSGNLDIDKDPQTFSALAPPGSAPVIRCRKGANSGSGFRVPGSRFGFYVPGSEP